MASYDTLVTALNDLRTRGFTTDFNLAFDRLKTAGNEKELLPEEFDIVEVYRFEGDTNPDDESVLFAIASHNGNIRGVLVSAFGAYSEPVSDELIKKLSMHR
jgi:hypothetical protein